ncbi:hypothetical protein [Cyanobium sp. Morenito 9A2]|uniref:hypothetical protein n=1 Tax=Cyanobium sp. Morenito 9A2 TaxID=2823718 RepID=UPI0020CC4B46|nr:hypothetical protein [Cyanobium sp. Morenito 9A2]MCP9848637.1 hypothetical protein [Cyanobium sp. Morenito 9A2]
MGPAAPGTLPGLGAKPPGLAPVDLDAAWLQDAIHPPDGTKTFWALGKKSGDQDAPRAAKPLGASTAAADAVG